MLARHPDRGPDAAHRGSLAGAAGEGGFGLIELVVAISVLGIITLGFAAGMASSLKAYTVSRAQTLSEQVATKQVEWIRQLPYDSVGLQGGNPPGSIVTPQTLAVDGYSFTVAYDVEYVNDPVPTAFVTEADYKRVKVTVTAGTNTKPDVTMETLVAPPAAASSTTSLVKVSVLDFGNNSPISGATVSLLNGPSSPRTDTTPSTGKLSFPALTPNPASGATQYYDLTAVATGYVTLKEDTGTAASVHQQLSPSQTFTTSIRMYKPVTIVANLLTPSGTPFLTTSQLTVHSSRGDETFPVTNGTATITSVAGELLVPGISYTLSATASSGTTFYLSPSVASVVPAAGTYPSSLQSTFNLTMNGYASAPLTITTRKSGGSGSGCAYTGTSTRTAVLSVDITGGPQNVDLTVQTVNGTVNVLLPTGSTAYTITIAPQGSYSGSGTKVVNGTTTCNLYVG